MARNLKDDWKKTQMEEATAKALSQDGEQEELIFADENARVAWEVGKEVDRIIASLPPESSSLQTETITFEPEHLSRGTYAVFFSGTVIATDHKGVLVVPERSLQILKQLQIPYHIL